MRFELLPTSFRKTLKIKEGRSERTISFDTRFVTRDEDSIYNPSSLKDGRAISSLSCSVFIRAGEGAELTGTLFFHPALSDREMKISFPDNLHLELVIPPDAIEILWTIISDEKSIILGGEVKGLPSKYPYGLVGSPYIWDVEEKDNQYKEVEKLWFIDLITANQKTKEYLAAMRSEDETFIYPSNKLSEALGKKYSVSSQMHRICDQAFKQAEYEATRRGLTGWDAERFIEGTAKLVDTLQPSLRKYGWKPEIGESETLWQHQNVDQLFLEGRAALGSWAISKDDLSGICRDLLARPWLRLDELEWIVVNALVFCEVFEFGETVKQGDGSSSPQGWAYASTQGNFRKMVRAKMKFAAGLWLVRWGLVAAGMFGAWLFVESNHYEGLSAFAVLGGSLLVLVWLIAGFPTGRRAIKEARLDQGKLLKDMWGAYMTMRPGAPLSPYQIRAALLVAQEKGAVWPSGTFPLLDRAAMREPPVWILPM